MSEHFIKQKLMNDSHIYSVVYMLHKLKVQVMPKWVLCCMWTTLNNI